MTTPCEIHTAPHSENHTPYTYTEGTEKGSLSLRETGSDGSYTKELEEPKERSFGSYKELGNLPPSDFIMTSLSELEAVGLGKGDDMSDADDMGGGGVLKKPTKAPPAIRKNNAEGVMSAYAAKRAQAPAKPLKLDELWVRLVVYV